jgi:uncharacterized protein YjbI with pentapeptide repeats
MANETKQPDNIGARPVAMNEGGPSPLPVAQTPAAKAFADEATDLKALRNAVVDAAGVGAGLWFSYLFVLVYLVVAVGSVTHRDLLFEHPIKLPFLGVDLPLTGFFVLGPGLFLIVHAYVLLHFVLLADKVGAFHDALRSQIADEATRTRLRRQLPSNIFVQFLAGPVEVRTGVMGIMLRLIAQISLVAGPLALLVFFQFQFLPYHNEAIAWWQRIAVVIDILLLWALWPSVARGEATPIASLDFRTWPVVTALLASLAPIFLVFSIATFPGELLDRTPSIRFVPTSEGWTSLHELLVAGDVDLVARKPTSLWSNRLVLPGVEATAGPVSLRGRQLEGAVLISARLAKVDFTAARLQEANLTGANLQDAKFECAETKPSPSDILFGHPKDRHCANLQRARLGAAQLQKASLAGAQLQGALLNYAQMQGAKLDDAQLQKAVLIGVELQGASLRDAQLQEAKLRNARLQGATLDGATLDGAELHEAELQGASLRETGLQGASFNNAQMQGVSLFGAQLWRTSLQGANLKGASLLKAQMQGTLFAGARLQGVSLDDAQMQGASLYETELQGASLDNAQLQGALLEGVRLQGASLDNAQLHGALLDKAQLQGASLEGTQLLGASLKGAQLQGAILKRAQLQGAILTGAALQGAALDNIFAWRADARNPQAKGTRVVAPEIRPKYLLIDCSAGILCDWSARSFAALKRLIEGQPEGTGRNWALERIATLDPATPLDGQEEMATAWVDLARSSPAQGAYEQSLKESLRETGCTADGAPYVIRGLLRKINRRFNSDSQYPLALAAAFLDEAHCPGARGLSEEDQVKLREIRDRPPPALPNPVPTTPKQ